MTEEKSIYNRVYKDEKRVVIYVSSEVKETLGQAAIDKGVSLSEFCRPALEGLANGLK